MKDLDKELPVFEVLFKEWFLNNNHAISFCLQMLKVIHVWDDLIDKDNELDDEDINEAFTNLMVSIPLNPFYQSNQIHIAPMMHNIILKWHTANVFEKEQKKDDIEKAYMLRAELYQLFVLCATLIGGRDWGRTVSVPIWRAYGESVKELEKEIKNA